MTDNLTANPLLIKEASCFDKQLRSIWGKIKAAIGVIRKASIPLGEIVTKMQAKGLHKYVRNPESRKGYISFEGYFQHLTDGELSKNILYLSKQMYQLTQGENALPAKTVAEMPQENVRLLSSLDEKDRTPEILKAVKSPNREFSKIVQGQINETLPPEKQKTPRIEFYREWHPDVVTKLEATIKRFHVLKGVVKDGDRAMTLDEKAVLAICFAAETECGQELLDAETGIQNDAMDIPETEEAVPEKPEAPKAKLVKTKASKTVAPEESSGRPKHAAGCHCLMCKPPKDSAGRAASAIQ